MLHGLLGGVLGGDLRRERRGFARAFKPLGAGRRPRNGVALRIRNGDHRVVEGGVHVRDARGNVLALATAHPGGFFTHPDRSFRARVRPGAAVPWRAYRLAPTSFCRLSAWPVPL